MLRSRRWQIALVVVALLSFAVSWIVAPLAGIVVALFGIVIVRDLAGRGADLADPRDARKTEEQWTPPIDGGHGPHGHGH